jgi:hypothetical protein
MVIVEGCCVNASRRVSVWSLTLPAQFRCFLSAEMYVCPLARRYVKDTARERAVGEFVMP